MMSGSGKTFVTNSRIPITEPWDTLKMSSAVTDIASMMVTHWVLISRYHFNHFRTTLLIPNQHANSSNKIVHAIKCCTLIQKEQDDILIFLMEQWMLLMTLRMVVSVLRIDLYYEWSSSRSLVFTLNFNWFVTTLSTTFEVYYLYNNWDQFCLQCFKIHVGIEIKGTWCTRDWLDDLLFYILNWNKCVWSYPINSSISVAFRDIWKEITNQII